MRFRPIALAFPALLLFFPCAHAASERRSLQQQIQPLVDEQMLAANAHDTDRFLATYLRAPGLTFIVNGTVIRGWDALRTQQLKWWQNGKSDAVYRAAGPVEYLTVSSNTVLVTESLASHRTLPDGHASDGNFVITMVWRKVPEGWRVTYAHESWTR